MEKRSRQFSACYSKKMMDAEKYLQALYGGKVTSHYEQELIAPDIFALLQEGDKVWVPFRGFLFYYLKDRGFCVLDDEMDSPPSVDFDVLYFGTPTIVNDRPLFPVLWEKGWNRKRELQVVHSLCETAIERGCKKIISGLGSGDILLDERILAMGGGTVVSWKKFVGFEDWIILREV